MHNGIAHEDAAFELARCTRLDEADARREVHERHTVYTPTPVVSLVRDLELQVIAIGRQMGELISQREEIDETIRSLSVERKRLDAEWRKLQTPTEGLK